MTQDWLSIRDAIKTIIEGVSGVKIVNAFPRIEARNHPGRWKQFFMTSSRIDAWTVLRTGAFVTQQTGGCVQIEHQVVIRGMLEHNDEKATQDEFDAKVDVIMLALYPNITLAGNATFQGPPNLTIEEIRQASETIIHYAEITTVVNQTITVTGIN